MIEPFIFASRGRYNANGTTSQNYEPRFDGVTNTLTSVEKDNFLTIPSDFKSTYQEEEREIKMNGFSVNDFFCGAGGMGLGFKQAGFEIKGAWDFDKYAVESYKHNVGDHVLKADISQMDFMDLPFADVWTFGFPCQDLSVAGKQAGMIKGQTRSGLFFEITRLLNEVREELSFDAMPKIIMAENVKGLKKFLPVLEEEYEAAGYKMYLSHQNKGVLNSKYWGVPQNRERYFVVGVRKDITKEFTFPEQQTDFIPKLSSVLEENVDEKYYLSEEKTKVILEKFKVSNIDISGFIHDRGTYKLQEVANCVDANYHKGMDNHGQRTQVLIHNIYGGFKEKEPRVFTEYSPTIRTAAGGGHIPSVMEIAKETGLLHADGVGKTIRVGGKGSLSAKHNYEHVIEPTYRIRKLIPRETARLQGFPDTYKQVVSDTQFYKQMGNAVTVNVARAIAERIQEFLKEL